jgi:hypothetical protein
MFNLRFCIQYLHPQATDQHIHLLPDEVKKQQWPVFRRRSWDNGVPRELLPKTFKLKEATPLADQYNIQTVRICSQWLTLNSLVGHDVT